MPPEDEGTQPEFVKVADVQKLVADAVNQAVTGAVNRVTKEHKAEIKALTDTVAELSKPKETPAPTVDDGGKKPDPATVALERKIADLEKRAKEADDKVAAAEKRARDDGAKTALRTALGTAVRPDAVDVITDLLFDARKRVSFDETGRPLFQLDEDTLLPLGDGVKSWLKSDEAKLFLPAPGAGGDTGRGGSAPRVQSPQQSHNGVPRYEKPATTDAERVQRAQATEAALREKYPDQF